MPWDSPLGPLAELVEACADLDDASGGTLVARVVVVETPLELAARRDAGGEVSLAVAPPRQSVVTTVMPTLHRLRLTIEATP